MKNKTRLAITAAIAFIAIACNPLLKIVDYSVDAGKGEAVKIAFLSDVHGSLYGNGQRELINKIKSAGTDIVVFGGDLFDEKNNMENSWTLVDALAGSTPASTQLEITKSRRARLTIIKRKWHGGE